MARREPNDRRKAVPNTSNSGVPSPPVDFNIYQDLARLQEMIFDSFHIPLTRWTIIDEGQIAEQIDLIYETVPPAVQKALAILQEEQEIITKAEEYAQQVLRSAQQRAAQILDESGIIQQAERQAAKFVNGFSRSVNPCNNKPSMKSNRCVTAPCRKCNSYDKKPKLNVMKFKKALTTMPKRF